MQRNVGEYAMDLVLLVADHCKAHKSMIMQGGFYNAIKEPPDSVNTCRLNSHFLEGNQHAMVFLAVPVLMFLIQLQVKFSTINLHEIRTAQSV